MLLLSLTWLSMAQSVEPAAVAICSQWLPPLFGPTSLNHRRQASIIDEKVGKVAMEADQVVEKVVDCVKGADERVQKKWDSVRSLHLKFS